VSAPLTGKLRDETGDRLTPTHTTKAGQPRCYYISNRLFSGGTDPSGWRLPGPKLEAVIASTIADHIVQATTRRRLLANPDLRSDADLLSTARDLVKILRTHDTKKMLRAILVSGTLSPRQITLTLDRAILCEALDVADAGLSADLSEVSAPASLRRRGVEAKLVVGDPEPAPDPVLVRTLAEAHCWAEALRAGTPMKAVAGEAGHHDAFIRTRGQLAFLSPKIQAAIRDGTQPPELTLKRILTRPVPLAWDAQERLYGVR
jgi:site-specific DNA recombinase